MAYPRPRGDIQEDPNAAMVMMSDDPPNDTNGKAAPWSGNSRRTLHIDGGLKQYPAGDPRGQS